MARAKKAPAKKTVVEKKNPGVFTEHEIDMYRKSLIQELTHFNRGRIPADAIPALAERMFNQNEETTLWLRRKGVLKASQLLIERYLKENQAS